MLVVEDERLLCDGIAEDLELEKYTVDRCYDGADAYERLFVEPYDLVILDLNLPGMDGLELLRRIRNKSFQSEYQESRKALNYYWGMSAGVVELCCSDKLPDSAQKMAAILPSDKPYLKTGVFETWRSRIPWLMLLMLSATFTGIIITKFESALAACVVLTSFIPMLSGTGGNSGSQSSVAVIRPGADPRTVKHVFVITDY